MAILIANDTFVMAGLDINWFYQFFASDAFRDDVNGDFEDEYDILTSTDEKLTLSGSGFAYTGSDMDTGTIQKWAQFKWDAGTSSFVEHFSFTDISEAMSAFFAAGQTDDAADDVSDDFTLIEAMLSGDDMMTLSDGDDIANGYGGNDTIVGNAGADELYGDLGDDILKGGSGDDVLFGSGGIDVLSGGADDDVLRGGTLGDTLRGNLGWDELFGEGGRDRMFGGGGNDALSGGGGHDIMRGGAGDDWLRGGKGNDKLFGNNGQDTFVFGTGHDVDRIRDFDAKGAIHDTLDLSGLASVKGWNDLEKNHMSQNGSNVVIDGLNGDKIILVNVNLSDLDSGDFAF